MSKTLEETIEEIKAGTDNKIEAARLEERVFNALPEGTKEDDGLSICIQHYYPASVTVWKAYNTQKTMTDVIDMIRKFSGLIVVGSHWNDGCTSVWPTEINPCATREGAELRWHYEVSLELSADAEFGTTWEISIWVRLEGIGLVQVTIPVTGGGPIPRGTHIVFEARRGGQILPQYDNPRGLKSDAFLDYGSGADGCGGQWHWKSVDDFILQMETTTYKP